MARCMRCRVRRHGRGAFVRIVVRDKRDSLDAHEMDMRTSDLHTKAKQTPRRRRARTMARRRGEQGERKGKVERPRMLDLKLAWLSALSRSGSFPANQRSPALSRCFIERAKPHAPTFAPPASRPPPLLSRYQGDCTVRCRVKRRSRWLRTPHTYTPRQSPEDCRTLQEACTAHLPQNASCKYFLAAAVPLESSSLRPVGVIQ